MKNSFQIRAGRALENTYFREVMRCLYRIQKYLSRIQNEASAHHHLIEIRESSGKIADLAMIHGFEGVENVARKMVATFDNLLRTSAGLHPSLHSKVAAAIETIQKIADMEAQIESELRIERVNQKTEGRRQKLHRAAREQQKNLEDLFQKQVSLFDPVERSDADSSSGSGSTSMEFDISEPEMVVNWHRK